MGTVLRIYLYRYSVSNDASAISGAFPCNVLQVPR